MRHRARSYDYDQRARQRFPPFCAMRPLGAFTPFRGRGRRAPRFGCFLSRHPYSASKLQEVLRLYPYSELDVDKRTAARRPSPLTSCGLFPSPQVPRAEKLEHRVSG